MMTPDNAYPIKLLKRSLEDWLRDFNADGDTIKIHVLKGGAVILQNERTLVCYILEAKDQDG